MIAGGGSTTDYWELEKQAQWLGKRGEKQKKRPTYEKVVHDKEWRFYPSKSTGSIGSSYDNHGRSKTLVQEYIERKQRKKRPRTLRPIPFPARAPGMTGPSLHSRLSPPGIYGHPSPQKNSSHMLSATMPSYHSNVGYTNDLTTDKFIQKSSLLGVSDVYGHLGSANSSTMATYNGPSEMSRNSDSNMASEYAQAQGKQRWAEHQSVIEEAVTSQLRRYKAENRALRKQKRATFYILRLLEQKILDLSGSSVQVEPIDPSAAGYEMHPDVYSILKGEGDPKERSLVAVNAKDIGEEDLSATDPDKEIPDSGVDTLVVDGVSENKVTISSSAETPQMIETDIQVGNAPAAQPQVKDSEKMNNVKDHQDSEEEQDSELIVQSKAKLQEIFAALDSSGNGSLNKRQFRRAIYKQPDLGQFITISDFQATFTAMDEDKNGCITYIEFEKYCLKSLRSRNSTKEPASSGTSLLQSELQEIFNSLDVNKNGTLDKKEFRKAILLSPKLGKFLKFKSFDKTFNEMDTNHDTLVTYSEFEAFCLKDIVDSLEAVKDPYDQDRKLLRSIFADLDSNNNNLLEKREFRRAGLRRPDLGSFLRPKEFLRSFDAMDTTNDGAISLDEFTTFCINAKYKYLDASPTSMQSLPGLE